MAALALLAGPCEDRPVRTAREAPLRGAAQLAERRFTAWRGRSGRRYVASVFAVQDGHALDFTDAVLLAVSPERTIVAARDSGAFGIDAAPAPKLDRWEGIVNRIKNPEGEVNIAVVGKYTVLKDAYKSLIEALVHGGIANNVRVKIEWIESEVFEKEDPTPYLDHVHGILVPGGFGERGSEGKILAARFARQHKVPYFGICFGMQMAVIEAARALAGVTEASSSEFGSSSEPVVGLMTEWLKGNALEKRKAGGDMGGTLRLGSYEAHLAKGSKIAEIYGSEIIHERHRHRYEVNIDYRDRLEACGLSFAGMSPDGVLPETVEIPDHPWFIGVQYHPELKSRPFEPHPLFASFIEAAVEQSRLV